MGKDRLVFVPGSGSQTNVHHHNTTVSEHRAPTDESIRILDEMYQKTIDRIIQRVNVRSQLVDIEAVFFEQDPPSSMYLCATKFSINEKRFGVRFEISRQDFNRMIHQANSNNEMPQLEFIRRIYKAFSEEIAILICNEIATTEFFMTL